MPTHPYAPQKEPHENEFIFTEQKENSQTEQETLIDNNTSTLVIDKGTEYEVSNAHDSKTQGANKRTINETGNEHLTLCHIITEKQMDGIWRCFNCGFT